MTMRIFVGFIALAGFIATAAAQTQPAPQAPPSAPPPAAAAPMKADTPSVDCRAQARSQGLRGQPARDAIALCVEELRTACLKETIAKKIVGKDRKDFIHNCVSRPKSGDQGSKG
jgi:hypothetical protein